MKHYITSSCLFWKLFTTVFTANIVVMIVMGYIILEANEHSLRLDQIPQHTTFLIPRYKQGLTLDTKVISSLNKIKKPLSFDEEGDDHDDFHHHNREGYFKHLHRNIEIYDAKQKHVFWRHQETTFKKTWETHKATRYWSFKNQSSKTIITQKR